MKGLIRLPHKVIKVEGCDKESLLQGLITNDIRKLNAENTLYALMLSAQGKVLCDLMITLGLGNDEQSLYIDCQTDFVDIILNTIENHKLFADVTAGLADDCAVFADLDGDFVCDGAQNCKVTNDPRVSAMGRRILTNDKKLVEGTDYSDDLFVDYEYRRVSNMVANAADMLLSKSFPLYYGMEELNAVVFNKGCYIGQEVTARMRYRGLIRKSVYLLDCAECKPNDVPAKGGSLYFDGVAMGHMLSCIRGYGLGLLDNSSDIVGQVSDVGIKVLSGRVVSQVK